MFEDATSIYSLLQARGGLFQAVDRVRTQSPEPTMFTRIARLGNLGQEPPLGNRAGRKRGSGVVMSASGTGLEDEQAMFLALVEGLERYCTCVCNKDDLIWASAKELGEAALDLDTVPRCSGAELAHPRCPLVLPDKSKQIRWVRGLSLTNGKPTYIPAVMVYLHLGYAGSAEKFWIPITTGCAAHTSYEQAVLNGICEVIERDAISVVWLQKLPLPKIEVDCVTAELGPLWARYENSAPDLQYLFYNATLDTGVSTIYALQLALEDKRLTTLISCSTDLSAINAVGKAIRDMCAIRIAFRSPTPIPSDWDEFCQISHGCLYMAQSERISAFDFLLKTRDRILLSQLKTIAHSEQSDNLRLILSKLRRSKLDAYVVDLSTDEAVRCGIKVVRVIIPGLQPLSFHYRARYLGHSRLYDVPRTMGFRVHEERELNHWPQPFA